MIPDISSLITAGALFVSNHSGGKDSQAMLINLLEVIPPKQLVVVHASLGAMDWPGALELAEKQAGDAGLMFIVARTSKTFFEMVERRFENRPEVPSWPSASTRQCTSDLKRGPIQREVRRYAKANGFKTIVNCLGLRAQESPGRAKRQAFSKMGISNSVNTWYEWLPVHDLLAEEVFAAMLQAKSLISINPAPAMGSLPKNAESMTGNSPVNDVTAGKPFTILLPDISSKAFWSGAGKNENFHPETYRRWVKEAIERYCAIARINVEVK